MDDISVVPTGPAQAYAVGQLESSGASRLGYLEASMTKTGVSIPSVFS